MDDLLTKYNAQKKGALLRGIAFDLSFDEWKEIWDGNFHLRGRGSDQLGMLRTYDEGGYSVGNVRIGTPKENAGDRSLVSKVRRSQAPTIPLDYRKSLPVSECFLSDRNNVFREYVEDDE